MDERNILEISMNNNDKGGYSIEISPSVKLLLKNKREITVYVIENCINKMICKLRNEENDNNLDLSSHILFGEE